MIQIWIYKTQYTGKRLLSSVLYIGVSCFILCNECARRWKPRKVSRSIKLPFTLEYFLNLSELEFSFAWPGSHEGNETMTEPAQLEDQYSRLCRVNIGLQVAAYPVKKWTRTKVCPPQPPGNWKQNYLSWNLTLDKGENLSLRMHN